MTNYANVQVQQPPLPGVAEGDVVWLPPFATKDRGGSPGWVRVKNVGPINNGKQWIRGVRIITADMRVRTAESDRTIDALVPLDKAARRVFEILDAPSTARGRAKVNGSGELPRRETR